MLLPAVGPHHTTWDPGSQRAPAPDWRHWGTAETVRRTMCVIAEIGRAHTDWPKLVVGDLSLVRGGTFSRVFGGRGHSSHQNGLDVDVYYPRRDRAEIAPSRLADIDFARSRELVDRFVAAGADRIFVGQRTPLRGPDPIVQRMRGHEDHFHVRFPNPEQPRPTTSAPPTTTATAEATTTSAVPVPSYPSCDSQ